MTLFVKRARTIKIRMGTVYPTKPCVDMTNKKLVTVDLHLSDIGKNKAKILYTRPRPNT